MQEQEQESKNPKGHRKSFLLRRHLLRILPTLVKRAKTELGPLYCVKIRYW